MKRLYILCLLLLSVTGTLRASNKLFRLFDVENGLPESQVRSLLQLPDGRILVITEGMVNVYDGSEFKTFHNKPNEIATIDYANFFVNYVDAHGLVWIRRLDSYLILDLKQEKFIEHPDQYVSKTFGLSEKLRNFFIDSTGTFWFYTYDNILYRYKENGQLEVVPCHFFADSKVYAVHPFQDYIYVFTSDGKMRCCDPQSLQILDTDASLESYFRDREVFSRVYVAADGFYLFCCDERDKSVFFHWENKTRRWKKLYSSTHIFTSVSSFYDRRILLSGEDGLHYFDQKDSLVHVQSVFSTEEGRTITGKVVDLLPDKQGGLWIAFTHFGLLYWNPYRIRFSRISNAQDLAPGWKDSNVTSLLQWSEKEMLVGTVNGLFVYNRAEGTMRVHFPELSGLFILSLTRGVDGSVWIGTIDSGCYRIQNGKLRHYKIHAEGTLSGAENNIRGVYDFGNLGCWLFSRYWGMGKFDPQTGDFLPLVKRHPELKRLGMVTHAIRWEDHSLLVASQSGLFVYDVKNDKVSFPESDSGKGLFNSSNRKYNCVMRDSRGWVWLGTQDGLNLYIPSVGKSYSFYMEDGLVNNSIRAIVEDKEGYIWVSTSNGLSHFVLSGDANKPVSYIRNFDSRSGLLWGEYQERASCLFPDGTLYFGGLNGISALSSNQMNGRYEELTPLFASLKVQGKEVQVGDPENRILTQSVFSTGKIELPHNQNNFSLDFSTLNFANPEQTHYRYRLEGSGNNEWTEVNAAHGKGTVSFTSLAPGKYRLVVYAAGGNYQWGSKPAVMEIVITPPFYLNAWSIVVYVLVAFALIVYLWFSTVRRKERQMRAKQEKEKLRQEEELNQMKYRFITNVSHELRTPLTLIVTPLEHLIHTVKDEPIKKQLKVISQGATELRGMINQLLDFRRIEMRGEKLNPTYNDISDYLQSVHAAFVQLAQDRGIVFNLSRQQLTLNMWYDKEKMQKILNNLLSNAFKFTPSGGIIDLRQSVGTMPGSEALKALVLEVRDTGCGIPPKDLPYIFERFYQGDNQGNNTGSGVGLHLTMEYVKMHGGVIEVQSELGKGSAFLVWIPLRETPEESKENEAVSEVENSEETERKEAGAEGEKDSVKRPVGEDKAAEKNQEEQLKILLVDDNDSLLRFVADLLAQEYRVLTATDGLNGLEMALKELPDLVISDVMMPRMDGYELCRRLKNDIRTSHIPIILLTAKGKDEDQISGYKSGADAYITKPFNYEILRLRILRIFELLDKRKKEFRHAVDVEPEKITISKLDEELIAKAVDLVMKNLDNSEYTVEQFSRDMSMDRTGLYRKLVSLVGLTPVAFIRSIRMKEAAKLLKEPHSTIAEIAYQVGYSTPRYFSKHFAQEFGMHPSEFMKQQ